jgi:anti-sigma regulatory factor (Ser/Thr protein kinase)
MARQIKTRGEEIRHFIIEHVEKHPKDISKVTAEHFKITRQAVNKHLRKLVKEMALSTEGKTRRTTFSLAPLLEWSRLYDRTPDLAEDTVWSQDISKIIGNLPDNVDYLWHYGFTEMFNNALDHSDATKIGVHIRKTAKDTELVLDDNGIGIFKKIQNALRLLDERHSVLELAKGKFTTDPKRHTGEGIFFTSRMFDSFDIMSGGVYFSHTFGENEDWIFERDKFTSGTAVWMKLDNHTARRAEKIFDQYASSGDDYGFNKTVVPVKLAQLGSGNLISRSQAKRLLTRVELFKVAIFNFKDVESVGQAFADEIFRVFAKEHPDIELVPLNANSQVKRMIERAKAVRVSIGSPITADAVPGSE